MLCSLLQFLASSAEDQIVFCGDRLPERASDMLLPPGGVMDDDRRYAIRQEEIQGHALILLAQQLNEYWPIVSGLPENTLEPDETIIEELLCLLEMMIWFEGNSRSYNRFWGKDAVRSSHAWELVRRLAGMALTRLDWPITLPRSTFADLLYG